LEWRRFGAAPIELDPFPGSIGGHVGGMIDVNIPFDPNVHVSVTLTNLHSYMSGSGKDRSRRESAKWQDTQVAHVSAGPKGSRLIFRFDVPADLPESNATQGNDSYHLWRLNVSADIPGVDFDRDYEIPVYATSKESRRLSEFSVQRAKSEQKKIDVQLVEKIVNMSHGPSGKFMIFPMGRNLAGGIGGVLFGAIFTGAGLFLTFFADHWFMGAILGAVGLVIFLSGFYFMFNSLEVREQGSNIQTIRRILGIPVKRREMRRSDFSNFDKHTSLTTQSGSKHVVHYSISARDRNGLKMVVGEGFRGAGQAAVAAEFIGRQFGLRAQSETEERVRSVDADDFLAAD
jgi:hypothetical protein